MLSAPSSTWSRLPSTLLQLCTRQLLLSRRSCSSSAFPTGPKPGPTLRFAPSPTGHLHLGGLRTALFNHLLARKLGGKWILRIEDTDQTRYVPGAVESLIETLKWAKLDYDDGPGREPQNGTKGSYFQSQRKEIYDKYLERLLESQKAYHCFCPASRLASLRQELQKSGSYKSYDRKCFGLSDEEVKERLEKGEKSVVRFLASPTPLVQPDLIYAPIHYPASSPALQDDFVLRKSDGLPTYHFANVVDDHEMGVSVVLRGEEWLPSTPKHLTLYTALSLDPPQFAHLPLLVNKDGSKLSKRSGDVGVRDYIEKGYEPEALINFVALLGWSPQGHNASSSTDSEDSSVSEVFTMQELVEKFSLEGINKNRATMSLSKLNFLNRAHLKRKVALGNTERRKEVAERLRVILREKFSGSEKVEDLNYLARVVAALKERIFTIRDIAGLGSYFIVPPDLSSPTARQLFATVPLERYRQVISDSIEIISAVPDDAFAESEEKGGILHDALVQLSPEQKLGKDVMNSLRHALTGQKVGAAVLAVIGTLGREETIKRLRVALDKS